MSDTDVLVVGAGPTGLTLACDLARRGTRVRLVDKSATAFAGSRGKGVMPRTVEVLDDLGIAERARAASTTVVFRYYDRDGGFRDEPLPAHAAVTPNAPYTQLVLPQWRTEQLIRDRLVTLGVRPELDTELIEFTQTDETVRATVRVSGRTEHIEARYLVGCDGGRSTVRTALGAAFTGTADETQAALLGDVEVTGLRPDRLHIRLDAERGILQLCPFTGVTAWQFIASRPEWGGNPPEPSLETFRRIVADTTGLPKVRLDNPTWLSTYRVNVRMVDRLRWGRVFLAGDAAHVHPPAAGLGLNTGVQDAYNLSWKLGSVLTGRARPRLLDSYEEERLPVAAWTLGTSSRRLRAMTGEITKGTTGGLGNVSTADTQQLSLGYRWSTLSWDRGDHSARLRAGDRAPDAPCRDSGTGAPLRLFDLFRGPHFTVLGFGDTCTAALSTIAAARPGHPRTALITTEREAGQRPGRITTLIDADRHASDGYQITHDALVLIRPDGYIATITAGNDPETILEYMNHLGRARACHPTAQQSH